MHAVCSKEQRLSRIPCVHRRMPEPSRASKASMRPKWAWYAMHMAVCDQRPIS